MPIIGPQDLLLNEMHGFSNDWKYILNNDPTNKWYIASAFFGVISGINFFLVIYCINLMP